jgi:hypothetical protein
MTVRGSILLVLMGVVLTALLSVACGGNGQGPAGLTIVVDSTADSNERDTALTLREAILLATGDLTKSDLTGEEADNLHAVPGAVSADAIGFDPDVFPPNEPATIVLTDTLPPLKSGKDAIDGTGAGVIIDGDKKGLPCLVIDSSGNSVHSLQIQSCHTGIWLKPGGDNNVVGGPKEGQGNVVSENTNVGIQIDGNANVVQGNYLGTDPTGTEARPNGMEGIWIAPDATDNLIGGSEPGERNVISGNKLFGINIGGVGATGNIVKGNLIGVDASGENRLQNVYGVVLSIGAKGNTIGGTSPGDANVISGNQSGGVLIRGPNTNDNIIIGNYIGTDASGQTALHNGTGIWLLDGAVGNKIGGPAEGEGNVIAQNGIFGIQVEGATTTGNAIRGNSIYDNARDGIILIDEGNTNLPAPSFMGVSPVSGTTCPGCIVDIYSDDNDEGKTYEGSTTADADGLFGFEGTPAGPLITATATDDEGNTSAFSTPRSVQSR